MGTCCGFGNKSKGTAKARQEQARAAKKRDGQAPGTQRRVVKRTTWKRPY